MFGDCDQLAGFHSPERDELGPCVWTQGRFGLRLKRAARFALLRLCYLGHDGTLSIVHGGASEQVSLGHGWQTCAVRLEPATAGEELTCLVEPLIDVPQDSRRLGVMLRSIELFDDEHRYEAVAAAHRNRQLNEREFRSGAVRLASLPPALRVTTEVRCNIPETSQACAYCPWDWAKQLEQGSPQFGLQTLEELGQFYTAACELNDCSVGEPTMHKQFDQIVASIDRDGKQLSLTTNGQLLTARRRRELLGKNVVLYVSVDSATAAGYRRYRNDRFEEVIDNLRALCEERKRHGNLPRVYAALIAMRSNVDELEAYFALMKDVGVDEVKVRLLVLDEDIPPVTVNNGYHFDYADEILHMDEVARLTPRIERIARQTGLPVYVDSQQFEADVSLPGAPLCSEPWKTLYVLRRGIMPCCHATEPIATWDQQQGRPLEEFLRDVFNGPAYQEIRRELAAGRLADYCLNTPSCPILKRMQQEGQVETPLAAWQRRAVGKPDDIPILPLVPLEALTCTRSKAA